MLHLQRPHLIVRESIVNRFQSEKKESVEVKVADFDGVQYHVRVSSEDKDTMLVSVQVRECDKILGEFKEAVMKPFAEYPMVSETDKEAGYDFTLKIDMAALPESAEEKVKLGELLAQLKFYITAAPLFALSAGVLGGSPGSKFTHEHRLDEFVHFVPKADRLTVIFDMSFKDPTDVALGKVFLQEFNEVRRMRELAAAPPPSYMPTAPQEIQDSVKENSNRIGFMSFALQPRHLSEEKILTTATHIMQFRSYIHYHIKCSKSHMHTRMRKRVQSMLQVLNRAVPEKEGKEKKTASGRSFAVAEGRAAGL